MVCTIPVEMVCTIPVEMDCTIPVEMDCTVPVEMYRITGLHVIAMYILLQVRECIENECRECRE
jgi:hypothetical protein